MELELWVANDEPSGQDRILEVDRPYPCVPRQGDIMDLGGGSGVSGQVEKVIFDPWGRVTLHFTGSRLQVPPGESWQKLLDSNFEKINSQFKTSAIHLKESNDIVVPVVRPAVPATDVLEGVEREDEEPPPRTTD